MGLIKLENMNARQFNELDAYMFALAKKENKK